MKIQWFGNSTFLLTTDLGKKILLDPFNIFSTLTENITADISTFSRPIDFSIVKNIKPFGKIVNTACNCDIENIKVEGSVFKVFKLYPILLIFLIFYVLKLQITEIQSNKKIII